LHWYKASEIDNIHAKELSLQDLKSFKAHEVEAKVNIKFNK